MNAEEQLAAGFPLHPHASALRKGATSICPARGYILANIRMEDNTSHDNTDSREDLTEEKNLQEAELSDITEKELPKKTRQWQAALGWAFGFAIWFCLALSAYYPDNVLMTWLFLAVFVLAMIIRRQVEIRTGISMRVFMKHLLISLVVFLVVFIILGPVTHILDVDGQS